MLESRFCARLLTVCSPYHLQIALFVPPVFLSLASDVAKDSSVEVGVYNLFSKLKGEVVQGIPSSILRSLGAKHVSLGKLFLLINK